MATRQEMICYRITMAAHRPEVPDDVGNVPVGREQVAQCGDVLAAEYLKAESLGWLELPAARR